MNLKASRPVNEIIVHCTATPEGKDYSVATIDSWHRGRGWSEIGYHYVVYRDGSVHEGRSLNKRGAHVRGRNTGTIGVVYVGGLSKVDGSAKDTRTKAQKQSLETLLSDLLTANPTIKTISGHNQYANKACPCFHAGKAYAHLTDDEEAAPEGGDQFLMNTREGNVRETAHWGKVITSYGRGTMMTSTGKVAGPWIEVVFKDGVEGWVHESIVMEVDDA